MSFNQSDYKHSFARENYDQLNISVPKGKKQELKNLAEDFGISLNKLITVAIEEKYLIDLSGKRENR